MAKLTERQSQIVENMRLSKIDEEKIIYELPAIERIVDDLEGRPPTRYTNRNKPLEGSYLARAAGNRPGVANALMENPSQRVQNEIRTSEPAKTQRPINIGRAIALAADSIRDHRDMWEGLGLMDHVYDINSETPDVLENRYAMAARMFAKYIDTFPMPPLDYGEFPGSTEPGCGLCPDLNLDFSAFLEMFRDWVNSLEPYMEIISKYIDKTIGAPTQRIKHIKHYTEDGPLVDIVDLDFSHFSQITPDSLVPIAQGGLPLAIKVDELTMYERYEEETRRYIDVFVIDNSISMAGEPILKAAAYLYNRLDKVRKGWAMLAIVEFDTSARLYEVPPLYRQGKPGWLIDTADKAQWAMSNIVPNYTKYVGGGTNISVGVTKGMEVAHKMEEFGGILPNITVVTDNDGSIVHLPLDKVSMPINGLALRANHSLQDYAAKTGGIYNNLEQIVLDVEAIKDKV